MVPYLGLLATLIFIFVVGIAESTKAAVFNSARNSYWRQFQNSTEPSDPQLFGTVSIANPPNAIQIRTPLIDVGILLGCKNSIYIEVIDWEVQAHFQWIAPKSANRINSGSYRQREALSYDVIKNSNTPQFSSVGAIVDARYVNDNRLTLPNFVSQNDVLDTNFRTMSREKFPSREVELHYGSYSEANSGQGQNPSEPSKNLRIESNNLSRDVLNAFVSGCVCAAICLGMAWGLSR